MSDSPTPPPQLDTKTISRIGISGAILGAIIIGLFLLLWFVTGDMGMSSFPRLVISVCIPPTLIALIFGIYLLTTRPSH
ncbi:MAG: hypothetical protein CUN52_02725 [Phototrophicales bacterium]|nr:MAG: hypothetical protein CUN52_02725 [Phototrophicales bacterium]